MSEEVGHQNQSIPRPPKNQAVRDALVEITWAPDWLRRWLSKTEFTRYGYMLLLISGAIRTAFTVHAGVNHVADVPGGGKIAITIASVSFAFFIVNVCHQVMIYNDIHDLEFSSDVRNKYVNWVGTPLEGVLRCILFALLMFAAGKATIAPAVKDVSIALTVFFLLNIIWNFLAWCCSNVIFGSVNDPKSLASFMWSDCLGMLIWLFVALAVVQEDAIWLFWAMFFFSGYLAILLKRTRALTKGWLGPAA